MKTRCDYRATVMDPDCYAKVTHRYLAPDGELLGYRCAPHAELLDPAAVTIEKLDTGAGSRS